MEFFASSEFRNPASYNSSGMNSSSDSASLFGSCAGGLQEVLNRPESSGSLDSITDGDHSSRESKACQRKAKDSGDAMPMDGDIRDHEQQLLQLETTDCNRKFGASAGPFLVTKTSEDGTVSNMNVEAATKSAGNSTSTPNIISRSSRSFDTPSALGSSASATTARLSVDRASPAKGRKKRSRASKRVPTTVLTTDASNFKAMVQQFTGIATNPFTPSGNSSANFSSNAGGINRSQPEHIFPKPFPHAALAARNNSSRCLTPVDVNPSLINPSTYNNFSPSLVPTSLNPLRSLHDGHINPFLQSPDRHNFLMNINRLSPNDQFCIYEEQQQQPISDYNSTGFMEELGVDCPISWRNI